MAKRVLIIGVERSERCGELLGSVLVGPFELLSKAAEEAGHGTILGERIECAY